MVILLLILLGFVALMVYLLIAKLGTLGFLALIAGIFYFITQLKSKQTA